LDATEQTIARAGLERKGSRAEALWRHRLEFEARARARHQHAKSVGRDLAEALLTFGLKVLGLYARGRRNAHNPILREERITFENLPPQFDGFKILHLSDFHFSPEDHTFPDTVASFLKGIHADACVLTGDYVFGRLDPGTHVGPTLQRVLAGVSTKHGVYAVLGNHDLSGLVDGLRDAGIRLLVNQGRSIENGGAQLWIGGVDDPHRFQCASIEAALAGSPPGAFTLLLAHSPEVVHQAEQHGVDLYLCGHTHGGQIRLPLIGAIHLNTRCERIYSAGRWACGAMQGYTTWGIGTTDIPVRYNCPPEAVLITLRRAQQTA